MIIIKTIKTTNENKIKLHFVELLYILSTFIYKLSFF